MTESSRQASALVPPLKWRLSLQCDLALIVAVVLGVLVSAPVIYTRVRCYAETTYLFGALPADDSQLIGWGSSRPAVVSFTTERRGKDLRVRSEYHSFRQQPSFEQITAQMRQLGYEFRGMRGGYMGMSRTQWKLLTAASIAAALVLCGALFQPALIRPSNCGGNSAALSACKSVAACFRLIAAERGDGPVSMGGLRAGELEQFKQVAGLNWLGGARILVTPEIRGGLSSGKEIIANYSTACSLLACHHLR